MDSLSASSAANRILPEARDDDIGDDGEVSRGVDCLLIIMEEVVDVSTDVCC